MQKKISSALISVFYKDGLEPVVKELHKLGVTIYSTGGTQKFIEDTGIPCVPVESLTTYPSILGGRVKTLHPVVFGGILGRRDVPQDVAEMKEYKIPEIDLVIVDLYPFEETLAQAKSSSFTGNAEEAEKMITEKIDIGGPSMIRAAAKNCKDLLVVAAKDDYAALVNLLLAQNGETSFEQRRAFAAKAFEIVMHYDIAISNYFNPSGAVLHYGGKEQILRYGENPHQQGIFYGNLDTVFDKLHGKELSYNNLVDVDAAVQLISEFPSFGNGAGSDAVFAIIKHTNVCGIAARGSIKEAWDAALAGDPESAFGGVLVCNGIVDKPTAEAISEIFFEVLIASGYNAEALSVLQGKKSRILLTLKEKPTATHQSKTILNGVLMQENDKGNYTEWKETGGRETTAGEKADLDFANIVCKHLKSNAIALVKNKQLLGKGCGQTSRIDALRQAVEKAGQFKFNLNGAVLASDAFFPFDDCVKLGHEAGITAFIQPGGSIRDKDSIAYCVQNKLAMVITGLRHFRH
ncbi:bifunctional phosphoribosylaminoimidazolecarboxamide formyltransferase/IMP cyclohydrolase [Agriterribacter sp.]|uniref:bifunctional phosphoribosylaminoimidazolecarboxamide formyltransferase/IMP cyclohydrolase n=1 Tax=Agriterribacter sp. TaxID=2821509 RepID=UPI002C581D8D|nr:bifunctional phosphoribosylaminoimidazolecarboxamide formyltransferase/IMP cyclohydrolase [Agriterribacter sp.]HTN08022.1 bifunctional phosphoribosylaminoimidazolecarboxamide formyltransferase/IMP cyclohydrolase [Agriterribacter sp.]